MEVTMTDIAREAGISIATVGRVIHNKGYVSQEARARVEAAIQKLGYVPNAVARTLTTRRSGIIGGLLVENLSNPHQYIVDALTDAAAQRGYRLFAQRSRIAAHEEERFIQQFIGMNVDGLVLLAYAHVPAAQIALLQKRSVPMVAIERPYLCDGVDNLYFRNVEGMRASTQKMLDCGHRRIAYLGPQPSPVAEVERDRLEGFQQAMEAAGIPRDAQLLCLTEGYGIQPGREMMEHILTLPERPTAVLCAADSLAAGAMQALYAAHIRVPEEMSISGYDNRMALELAPPINSTEPNLERVGTLTMELLLRRMAQPDAPAETHMIDLHEVDRGTVQQQIETHI